MNPREFADVLQRAVVGAFSDFREQAPDEVPYALAVMLGQCGNYLGYAIATEEGLRRVALDYSGKGYRYQGWEWEEFDNVERLSVWLRWFNPDDGWQYGDFPERFGIAPLLADLVENNAFGKDAEGLEEFCTEVLTRLQSDTEWQEAGGERVVVGVTYGSDPRDFLRTATRANRYDVASRIWAEQWRSEELSSKIVEPG